MICAREHIFWLCLPLAIGCNFRVPSFVSTGPSPFPDPTGMTAADLASPSPTDMASPVVGDLAMPDLATLPALLTPNISNNPNSPVDLTAVGTLDWAHWGLVNSTSFDHKNGANLISNFTNVAGTGMTQISGYPVQFSWTDGTPTARPSNPTDTGVYTSGNGSGFRITVPADQTTRTLRIWGGGQQSMLTITAHMGDGSIADYVATTGDNGNNYQRELTLIYRSLTPCMLRVDFVVSSGTFVHLLSAALSN